MKSRQLNPRSNDITIFTPVHPHDHITWQDGDDILIVATDIDFITRFTGRGAPFDKVLPHVPAERGGWAS